MYDGKSDTLYLAWSAERRGCKERKIGGGIKKKKKRTSVILFRGICTAHARVRCRASSLFVVLMQLTDCVSSPYLPSLSSRRCVMRGRCTQGSLPLCLFQRLRAHHFHRHGLPCVKDRGSRPACYFSLKWNSQLVRGHRCQVLTRPGSLTRSCVWYQPSPTAVGPMPSRMETRVRQGGCLGQTFPQSHKVRVQQEQAGRCRNPGGRISLQGCLKCLALTPEKQQ